MLFFIRYIKGLGNAALYTRLRNGSGQYWDFGYLTWVDNEAESTKIYLTETQDNDTVEALYSSTAAPPSGGPWIEEVAYHKDEDFFFFSAAQVIEHCNGYKANNYGTAERQKYPDNSNGH